MREREQGIVSLRVRDIMNVYYYSLSLSPHHKHNTGASAKSPEAIFFLNDHTAQHVVRMNGHTHTHTRRVTALMVCVTEQHLRWSSCLDGVMWKTNHLLLSSFFSSSSSSSSHYSAIRLADATHCLNGAIRVLGVRLFECVYVNV